MSEPFDSNANPFVQWARAWSKAGEQFGKDSMAGQGQELFKQWQDMARKMLEELVRSDSFLVQMGKSMEVGHLFKSHAEGLIERQLQALRLPTRSDLQELHGKLRQLDDRMETIDDRLVALSARLDALHPAATPTADAPALPVEEGGANKKRGRRGEETPHE